MAELKGNYQIIEDLRAERAALVKALEDLLGSSMAINQWLTNWNTPFADEDEWHGDKKLFQESRNKAASVLGAVGGPRE